MSEAANAPGGQVIDGRYRIVRKIAEGGMATVYQAVDERLERNVAIKIMHIQLAQGSHRDQFVERFRREAKSAAAIANPHIVQVYDTGEYNGLEYLVMEYVHGVNLRYDMNQSGTFNVRETLRIVTETLDGLASAHQAGVVHRDIKPENILINDRGHVQITDFGLAKAASQATLSSTGMLLGTAAYLAPEMIENNQATTEGDLYSVGVMAWEMLAGDIPFTASNPVTLVFKHVHEDVPSVATQCEGVDRQVAAFIARLSARNMQDRPKDAVTALQEIHELAASLPPAALAYRKRMSQHYRQSLGEEGRITADTPVETALEPPTAPLDMAETLPLSDAADNTSALPRDASTQVYAKQEAGTDSTDTPKDAAGQDETAVVSKKSRLPVIITLIAVFALCASGGGFAWWYYLGPGSYWSMPRPTDLSCVPAKECKVANVDWKSYEGTLKALGIPYTAKEQYSDTIAKGKVISTNPAAVGAHVSKRANQIVTVAVSLGVKRATVPADISDVNSSDGKQPLQALTNAGFTNVAHDASKDQYSLNLPAGTIQSLNVAPGATLPHNQAIAVQLSKGPMPVSMPNVVGHGKAQAQSAFNNEKLKANYSEQYSDTVPAGTVISASMPPGTQLHWGDSVNVVVSKGPEMVTIPNVVGQRSDVARSTLEVLGLKVQGQSQTTLLPSQDKQVASQSPAAGSQVRKRGTDGNPTTVTLKIYTSIWG